MAEPNLAAPAPPLAETKPAEPEVAKDEPAGFTQLFGFARA